MKKKSGFTLIELLAVIVILAIIALIATPMVLKYIKTSKEGSYDNSIDNILRAADNYYAGSLLNTKTTYPLTFAFPNNKELGVKGKQPDSGSLTIYEDGSTYLYAVYDEIIYTKLPNEQRARRYNMVVGDDITWTTDGKGKITKYNMGSASQKIEYQLEIWLGYLNLGYVYALRDADAGEDFDYNLSLKENIEKMEQEMDIDRGMLPLELNKEIDEALEIFNTKSAITEEEFWKMVEDNREKLPYFSDYYDLENSGSGTLSDLKAYQLIRDNIEATNILVIPNYVKHSDGTKEKITSIDSFAFRDKSISGAYECYIAPPYSDDDSNLKGMNLIIPEGIEEINDGVFQACILNSVNIGNTVKTIGESSFYTNLLETIILPSSLEVIGANSFMGNNIRGNIIIPKGVTIIEHSAFEKEAGTCTEDQLNGTYGDAIARLCRLLTTNRNEINSVTFEKGSKIETIEYSAFAGNKIENITIPGSIKTIGSNAFNCETLKSATIERAKGSDLRVDATAFGNVTPVYK
ncbi:MAG: leucine-rich repeat domain-containing protein [Bacilli bacterium]